MDTNGHESLPMLAFPFVSIRVHSWFLTSGDIKGGAALG
jgi:hypothetical protein